MYVILAQDPITFSAILTYIFWNIAVPVAIATALAYAFRRKPPRPKPAGKDAFELPTAEEGRPLPVLFGCRRIRGVNAISPLFGLYARRSGSSKRPNTFYYHIGLHLGVCHANIDGIKQIWMAETCLWPVLNDPTQKASDNQTMANVQASECWGGYNREGGAKGHIQIQYGASDQTLNPFLEYKMGSNQPAYRGLTSLILGSMTSQTPHGLFYIGTMPIIKPISVLAKRNQKKHSDGSAIWYQGKAAIGSDGDLNAIHIVYELLFDAIIGLGKDPVLCGSSFQTAADTCYTEGYGLSNVWDWAPDDIASMIEQIEQIIDGKLYMDPSTGKFEIGLIRPDYNPETLETFGPEDFWVETMPTSSLGRVPSKTIVRWHDRTNLQSRPAVDDDIALLVRQGGHPVVNELDYSAFICDGDLANKIAARTQAVFSAMPKRFTVRALRTMSHLHETSVIKISYPALNIDSMIVRVLAIDRGSLTDGECIIEIVEDVFGVAYTVYGSPPPAATPPAEEELEEQLEDLDDYSQLFLSTPEGGSYENGPYITLELKEYHNTGDDSNPYATDTFWLGWTFTAESSYSLSKIRLKLCRSELDQGAPYVSIRNASGNFPTGEDLAYASLPYTAVQTGEGTFLDFDLNQIAAITQGNRYTIILRSSGAPGELVGWRLDNDCAESLGTSICSDDSGTSWVLGTEYGQQANAAYMFENWGY